MRPLKSLLHLFLLIPFLGMGQSSSKNIDCVSSISVDDIYSIVNEVIKQRSLDKTHILNIKVRQELSSDQTDDVYLKSLLKDSSRKSQKIVYDSLGNVKEIYTYKDKNLLDPDDIKYIKCLKKRFKKLKWDNSKLHFGNTSPDKFYSFSLPYFNLRHDLVLISYSYYCGGLCGDGATLVLRRKGDAWEIDWLELWMS